MDKQTRSREFLRRFERHERELRALYLELYHGDTTAYEYFTEMLRRMWSERSEELRCIDRERLNNPDWYKGHDLVGMLMYVKAFAGTLRGVEQKLDYIESCGVNYLHLFWPRPRDAATAAMPSRIFAGSSPSLARWPISPGSRRRATSAASPCASTS